MKKMERLILRKQKYKNNINVCRVRVDSEAKEIVEKIAFATNLSEKEIVSTLIKYANDYVEIKE